MERKLIKKVTPIEINVSISKTIQEKQFEPFNAKVAMKSTITPNEVSSEFHRVHEVLEDELTRIINTRLGIDTED